MKQLANNVTGGVVKDSGHYIPEEQPEVLVKEIMNFISQLP
jgi:pimeloyl-ACP methyl ester carboxylesterase